MNLVVKCFWIRSSWWRCWSALPVTAFSLLSPLLQFLHIRARPVHSINQRNVEVHWLKEDLNRALGNDCNLNPLLVIKESKDLRDSSELDILITSLIGKHIYDLDQSSVMSLTWSRYSMWLLMLWIMDKYWREDEIDQLLKHAGTGISGFFPSVSIVFILIW